MFDNSQKNLITNARDAKLFRKRDQRKGWKGQLRQILLRDMVSPCYNQNKRLISV